jgi:replicative superfamily II helicase
MLALANAIFELLYPNLKTQAVFTVPTRALANDKLSEWRARGWDGGISTGDDRAPRAWQALEANRCAADAS